MKILYEQMKLYAKWTMVFLMAALLVSACADGDSSPITPAADRPTVLIFYTEN